MRRLEDQLDADDSWHRWWFSLFLLRLVNNYRDSLSSILFACLHPNCDHISFEPQNHKPSYESQNSGTTLSDLAISLLLLFFSRLASCHQQLHSASDPPLQPIRQLQPYTVAIC